jgi:hypothetical protein
MNTGSSHLTYLSYLWSYISRRPSMAFCIVNSSV